MKKTFKVFPILFLAITVMVIHESCKKGNKDSGGIRFEKVTSPELLAKVKAFQEVQMKEGITIMTRKFEP